jgi:hypothetical protein
VNDCHEALLAAFVDPVSAGGSRDRPRRYAPWRSKTYAVAVAVDPFMNASKSALIWSAWVVGMPCGKSL